MSGPRQRFPLYPMHSMHSARTKEPARLPSWPAVSIVLLVTAAAVILPAILTSMNLYLLLLTLIVWAISGEALDRNLLRIIAPFLDRKSVV